MDGVQAIDPVVVAFARIGDDAAVRSLETPAPMATGISVDLVDHHRVELSLEVSEKTFLVRYNHDGAEWGLELPARDIEDAKVRISRRSEEHTSELQSLMRISNDVFCLK